MKNRGFVARLYTTGGRFFLGAKERDREREREREKKGERSRALRRRKRAPRNRLRVRSWTNLSRRLTDRRSNHSSPVKNCRESGNFSPCDFIANGLSIATRRLYSYCLPEDGHSFFIFNKPLWLHP